MLKTFTNPASKYALNMLLAFWKSVLQYAYKRCAFKKTCMGILK